MHTFSLNRKHPQAKQPQAKSDASRPRLRSRNMAFLGQTKWQMKHTIPSTGRKRVVPAHPTGRGVGNMPAWGDGPIAPNPKAPRQSTQTHII